MIDFHSIENAVNKMQLPIVSVAVAFWVVAFVGQLIASNKRQISPTKLTLANPWFFAGVVGFLGIIFFEFAFSALVKFEAEKEIYPKLFGHVDHVEMDGARFQSGPELVTAIREMHDTWGHHSHPTERYRVKLMTDHGPLILDLCRDSQDRHEYWVFYPGFHSTELNSIGHAFTSALDRSRSP